MQRDLLFYGVTSRCSARRFPGTVAPETTAKGRFEGVVTGILRRYGERADNAGYREKMEKLLIKQTCPDCRGERLRPESAARKPAPSSSPSRSSRGVSVAGRTIARYWPGRANREIGLGLTAKNAKNAEETWISPFFIFPSSWRPLRPWR